MRRTRDITIEVSKFQEALRHTWNTYFQTASSPMGPDLQDAFGLVEQGLLQGVLLCEIDRRFDSTLTSRRQPLSFIHVMPRPEMTTLALRVGVPSSGAMIWGAPEQCDVHELAELEFVRFFDWLPYEQVSLSLVEVYVARLSTRRELEGRMALVAAHDVRFLLAQ
jgi:hypothetical protein